MKDTQNKLINPLYIKGLLSRAGTKPQHEAGQNFLICPEVIEATLLAINDGPKNITELGAGIGTLTSALLEASYSVKAIEQDQVLAKILTHEISTKKQERLELIIADLRKTQWQWSQGQEKTKPYQLVGNIPYNLSGLIIRRLVQLDPAPKRVVLLIQKEVGERLIATPPNMSLLSLAVNLWGKADLLLRIPASCFWPAPKVESCLVMLTPKSTDKITLIEREKIMATARIFFQTKRKQMAGVLKRKYKMEKQENAIELLKKANIDGNSRPQELTLKQWQGLSRVL